MELPEESSDPRPIIMVVEISKDGYLLNLDECERTACPYQMFPSGKVSN